MTFVELAPIPARVFPLKHPIDAQFLPYRQGCSHRSFVTGGIIASAEDKGLVGGFGGILPQKIFKLGGSETLFSALVIRYVSEKSTSNMRMANKSK